MPGGRLPGFDPEIIASLREQSGPDGSDFLKELLDLFLEDAPLALDDLDAATRCGNADWLMRSAHDLGGGAGNVGATGLSALCRQVELQARSGKLEAVEAAVLRIRNEYDAVSGEAMLLLNPSPRRTPGLAAAARSKPGFDFEIGQHAREAADRYRDDPDEGMVRLGQRQGDVHAE